MRNKKNFVNETYTVKEVTFKMVAVKAGTFTMGTDDTSVYDRYSSPAHQVRLTNDYWIGETEVTQELWQAVMESNPSCFLGKNLPVEQVSWDDIQQFITELNQLTGKTFRLPTEAEWEFAARGGNQSQGYKYSGSNNIDEVARYFGNSRTSQPVKTKAANELGLYDMSGNVWEWVNDWYGDYSSDPQTNPQGPTTGSFRVIRSGGWSSALSICRVANRNGLCANGYNCDIGFRLACSSN
ncbi:MAG: formylglycine-generating enzyme family protein [Bacteroidales bacterium]|jgi:formylglycine-generating enzyme required for sulfatase activity|nr:formylglycine-generating enzyme family protein [Bacteroidales bacterium]